MDHAANAVMRVMLLISNGIPMETGIVWEEGRKERLGSAHIL